MAAWNPKFLLDNNIDIVVCAAPSQRCNDKKKASQIDYMEPIDVNDLIEAGPAQHNVFELIYQ